MSRCCLCGVLATVLLAGCQGTKSGPDPDTGPLTIRLTSSAFREGEPIPREHTADGRNVSPPLEWAGAPDGTKSYALLCEDPDAPGGLWVHWVLFNVPADRRDLPERVPPDPVILGGARQGTNDFYKVGYGGPDPPAGKPHHYVFTLYALDAPLDLQAAAGRQQLLDAKRGHVLASGRLTGTYGRP